MAKSEITVATEIAFQSAIANVWRKCNSSNCSITDVPTYGVSTPELPVVNNHKYVKVDFRIRLGDDPIGTVYYTNTNVGIELKTSKSDLINSIHGKNFNSFFFNYLLVPIDLLYYAYKFLYENEKYKHVGLLVINTETYLIELFRPAEKLEDTSQFDTVNTKYSNGEIAYDMIPDIFAPLEIADVRKPARKKRKEQLDE